MLEIERALGSAFFAQGRCHFRNVAILFEVGVTYKVLFLPKVCVILEMCFCCSKENAGIERALGNAFLCPR